MTIEQICGDCNGVGEGYEEQRYAITVYLCPLHAAAPDLLAAAKDVVDLFADFEMDEVDVVVFQALKDAIQKATSPQAR